jgi:hypothetical protein
LTESAIEAVEPTEAPAIDETEATVPEIVSDDIRAAIEAEFANRPQAIERPIAVRVYFQEMTALVASATSKRPRGNQAPTVSENTALKLMELSLMWALNHRDATSSNILEAEVGVGSEVEDAAGPLIPNEIIGGTTEPEGE